MSSRQFQYNVLGLLIAFILVAPSWAQQFEEDPALQKRPVQKAKLQKPVLQGNITTLDDALLKEKYSVDWYRWYLNCRDYLAQAGGFVDCPLGTMIRFNKNGTVQALSQSPSCIISAAQKHFPLPSNTKLSAILLPIRKGSAPPASAEELYRYLKGLAP